MKRLTKKKLKTRPRPHTLAEIQHAVFSAISTPLTKKQRSSRKLLNGTSMEALAKEFMQPNDRLTELERIEIYNRQYWFRLINCLYDDFPGLRAVLGDRRFYTFVQAYLNKYPSHSYTLGDLGLRIPDFLRKEPKYAGARAGIALEMSRFECAQMVAFSGLAYPPVDFSKMKIRNPDKIKLKLQPYISFFEFNYPWDEFILALHKEQAERSEAGTEQAPKTSSKPCSLPKKQKIYIAIHRINNILYYTRLEKPAYLLLCALKNGETLGNACERASKAIPNKLRQPDQVASLIHRWFSEWRDMNWFCVPD